jgi:hypothetical protein
MVVHFGKRFLPQFAGELVWLDGGAEAQPAVRRAQSQAHFRSLNKPFDKCHLESMLGESNIEKISRWVET